MKNTKTELKMKMKSNISADPNSAELQLVIDQLVECESAAYAKLVELQQLVGNYRGQFLLHVIKQRKLQLAEMQSLADELLPEK